MTWMFVYAALIPPCYFWMFCNGANLNFRFDKSKFPDNPGFVEFHRLFFRQGWTLFLDDHFGLHCPWSWKTAKAARLAHMRVYLGEKGRCNERLGHITAADCDDPAKQEGIARGAFTGRGAYWLERTWIGITAPFWLAILVISALVIMSFSLD